MTLDTYCRVCDLEREWIEEDPLLCDADGLGPEDDACLQFRLEEEDDAYWGWDRALSVEGGVQPPPLPPGLAEWVRSRRPRIPLAGLGLDLTVTRRG